MRSVITSGSLRYSVAHTTRTRGYGRRRARRRGLHYDRAVDVLRRCIRLLEAFSNVFLGIGYLIVLVIASVMAVYACVNLQNKVVFEISAGLWDGRCILWIVATASKYS